MKKRMFAVGMLRDKKGIYGFYLPIPKISKPTEVLVKIIETGVDGTDFGMVKHDTKDIALEKDRIILGHEVIGKVVAAGKAAKKFRKGDFVTTTVRRGCNICAPCLHNQSDMCMTGLYTERGIHRLDGFLTEYFVDGERYLLKLHRQLVKYGVLIEPLSIAEKAVEQMRIIQSRLPWGCSHPGHKFTKRRWGGCKTALVIGAGPLGFLATCLLRLAGVTTYVVEVVPETHFKVQMAKRLGAHYIDAKNKSPAEIVKLCCSLGTLDIIFEASGASKLSLSLIPYMSRSSIYIMTGIPRGEKVEKLDANSILRQIVRHNIVIVGSVNSNMSHFKMAIHDLPIINREFHGILDSAITHRFKLREFKNAFNVTGEKQLKVVVEVAKGEMPK